jgi:translation initiation factor 1
MSSRSRKVVVFLKPASGDMAEVAAKHFTTMVSKFNMGWSAEIDSTELESAKFVVAFEPTTGPEHLEVWPTDMTRLDAEVSGLVARLFTGAKRSDAPPRPPVLPQPPVAKPKPKTTLKLQRETKGRGGKGVTIISDFPMTMPLEELAELATLLKTRCGTGGTVKERTVEIQGDQRDRLTVELEKLGYKVKRAGG